MAALLVRSPSNCEEENAGKSVEMRAKTCYMHIKSFRDEHMQEFTVKRWETFKHCLKQWLCLRGHCATIAKTYQHCLTIEFDNMPVDAGFHPTCYRRFIDKRRLDAAEKNARNHIKVGATKERESVIAGDTSSTSGGSSETQREKLRSRMGPPVESSCPVLPVLCLICKRVQKHITVSGKRTKDPLTLAQTLSAGV